MDLQTALTERIRQRLDSGDIELPVFDRVAIDIHREVQRNRLDARGLCELLEQDVSLVSEVLRMANSSFFGGLTEVRTLRDACVRMGVRQIGSIVFSVSQKRLYSASAGPFRTRLARLWQHASAVSIGARWLALRTGRPELADEALIAGLLHDVGKLALLCVLQRLAREAEGLPDDATIDAVLARLSREQGAELLQLWNVPVLYREVQQQLDAEPSGSDSALLVIVRLADRVCVQTGSGESPICVPLAETERVLLGLDEDDIAELVAVLSGGSDEGQRAA